MRWVLGLLVLLGPAQGLTAEIVDDDFRLEVGSACIAWPREKREPAACDGLPVDRILEMGDTKNMLAMAIWPSENEGPRILVVLARPAASPTPSGIKDTLAGFYNSSHPDRVTRREDPRLAHTELVVSGTKAVRFAPAGEGEPVAYFVYGGKRLYTLLFASPAGAPVSELAAEMVAKVQVAPLGVRRGGTWVPWAIGGAGALLGVVMLVYLLRMARS